MGRRTPGRDRKGQGSALSFPEFSGHQAGSVLQGPGRRPRHGPGRAVGRAGSLSPVQQATAVFRPWRWRLERGQGLVGTQSCPQLVRFCSSEAQESPPHQPSVWSLGLQVTGSCLQMHRLAGCGTRGLSCAHWGFQDRRLPEAWPPAPVTPGPCGVPGRLWAGAAVGQQRARDYRRRWPLVASLGAAGDLVRTELCCSQLPRLLRASQA